MNLKIIKQKKSINSEQINTFEKINGITLPNEYKKFLIEFNGGKPENSHKYVVRNMYGKDYWMELEELFSIDKIDTHLNCEYCPNLVFIGKSNHGTISINLDEDEYKGNLILFQACGCIEDYLAENFDNFLNSFLPRYDNEFQRLCELKDFEDLKNLLNNGFNPKINNSKGKSLLYELIFEHYQRNNYDSKYLDILRLLLKKGGYEKEFIFYAFLFGENVVKIFIEEGTDINEKNEFGITPLMYASTASSPEFLNYLLKNGANINLRDNEGKNALDHLREDLEYDIHAPEWKKENLKILEKYKNKNF
jgi:hypothetical protein